MMRALRFLVLAALGLAAAGCGGGLGSIASGITGGSVPIGPTRVAGEAALATQPAQPVVGAQVVVTDATATEQRAVTDSSGQFALASAAPGPATLRVSAKGVRPLELPLNIPSSGVARVALALIPSDVTPGEVQSFTVDHQGIEAQVGEVVRIHSMRQFGPGHDPGSGPGQGPPPDLTPSWVVEGGVGIIRHGGPGDALFEATQVGTGRIIITLGDRQITIPVTVTPIPSGG